MIRSPINSLFERDACDLRILEVLQWNVARLQHSKEFLPLRCCRWEASILPRSPRTCTWSELRETTYLHRQNAPLEGLNLMGYETPSPNHQTKTHRQINSFFNFDFYEKGTYRPVRSQRRIKTKHKHKLHNHPIWGH